jgi:hypothetical protein
MDDNRCALYFPKHYERSCVSFQGLEQYLPGVVTSGGCSRGGWNFTR